ncbi:MAG: hypothetical protein C0P74_014395 [Gammaproteobacteria bacterium]
MSQLTPAERVAAYIRLRDYKKAAEEEFKKSLKRVIDAMEKLEAELLNDLNASGANSLSCDAGTVYKNTQFSATVENREAFREYVVKNDLWEAMDIRANKTFVKEFMEREGTPLPGVKVTQIATVGVRRS